MRKSAWILYHLRESPSKTSKLSFHYIEMGLLGRQISLALSLSEERVRRIVSSQRGKVLGQSIAMVLHTVVALF